MQETINHNLTDKHGKQLSVITCKGQSGSVNIWKIIDVEERLDDNKSRRVKLSIQNIPEDRYEEALDHMCQYYVADAVTFKCLNVKEDPVAVEEIRLFWNYLLKIGMSIGIFELGENNELRTLIGMNVLFVTSNEINHYFENYMKNGKSAKIKKIASFAHSFAEKIDTEKVCGTNTIISDAGMSVKPSFRGQKLGVHLLETRTEVARKYKISATSTIFTGPASQRQAERAGFRTVLSLKYVEALDDNGKDIYPNIEAEEIKLMIKNYVFDESEK